MFQNAMMDFMGTHVKITVVPTVSQQHVTKIMEHVQDVKMDSMVICVTYPV